MSNYGGGVYARLGSPGLPQTRFDHLGTDVAFVPGQVMPAFVLEQKSPRIGVDTRRFANQGLAIHGCCPAIPG